MTENKPKSTFEKMLNVFAEVGSGEALTVILLTLNVFLVLTSYYIAKVVREPFILAGGVVELKNYLATWFGLHWPPIIKLSGAELKSYLAAVLVILLIGAVRVYAWLAGIFPRKQLINYVNSFFSACLVVFYLLAQMEVPLLGILFFLWVGMFNVMVVAQFWSFANDVYTPEQGKRLFAIVAFGASSGAVLGSYLPKILIDVFGLNQMLLLAAGVLLLSLVITNYIDAQEQYKSKDNLAVNKIEDSEVEISKEGAFKLVFQNKYLLMIAFLVLLLNWVNTTGEYILGRTVKATAENIAASGSIAGFDVKEYIGKFYADFFTGVNIAGVIIQLFLVSRILKYLGIRIAILLLPVIACGGYLLLAVYPVLSVVRWAKTGENATDYSLNNTVRHALFLPTSREEKYKAKQAIDSFFHRSGDVLSAVVVFVGFELFALDTRYFAIFNLVLVIIWLFLAVKIGQENKRLTDQRL